MTLQQVKDSTQIRLDLLQELLNGNCSCFSSDELNLIARYNLRVRNAGIESILNYIFSENGRQDLGEFCSAGWIFTEDDVKVLRNNFIFKEPNNEE